MLLLYAPPILFLITEALACMCANNPNFSYMPTRVPFAHFLGPWVCTSDTPPIFGRVDLEKISSKALEEGISAENFRASEPDLEGLPCPWLPFTPCVYSMQRGPAKGRPEQTVLGSRGDRAKDLDCPDLKAYCLCIYYWVPGLTYASWGTKGKSSGPRGPISASLNPVRDLKEELREIG